jgi:AcrR family transcriptional regulator
MIEKVEYLPSTVAIRTEPVQQRSADRIASLLDAAAALIDEHGIDGLTTSDVATRSGSSVGVVYRYFPNIQSLLRALASRNMQKFLATALESAPATADDLTTLLNSAIDVYVTLVRTEPGFRALGFGDVIDRRFVQPDASNNSVLAGRFNELVVTKFGFTASDNLLIDLEIIIEIAAALLQRAFLYEKQGDERFIARLREIVRDYVVSLQKTAAQ